MTPSMTSTAAPTMRPALRWALLGAACAAAAVALLPDGEVASVAPTRATASRPAINATATPAVPDATSVSTSTSTSTGTSVNTGRPWPPLSRAAQAAWEPAPPRRAAAPAPVALAEAPPPTPTFPYQWIGQIDEAGRVRVFLVDAQRLWAVAPGETVEPGWRVDGINAGNLQLTWLATGATVQLAARP